MSFRKQWCLTAFVWLFAGLAGCLGAADNAGRVLIASSFSHDASPWSAITPVFKGESPAGPDAPAVDPAPMFDWRVDVGRMPSDSVRRFRQPSVWARYHWQILGALCVILLQTATIVLLLVQRMQRERVESGLRENKQFIELATAAGELGLWVRDVRTGILRSNARFRSLFGFTEDAAISFDDVIARLHPTDRAHVETQLRSAIREGRAFEFDSRLRLPDGTERWVSIRGMAVLDDGGQPTRTQGVVLDRTARHEAEMEALRHRDELRHIGRVHVLGQLSSALAHELNQPLGAILSNAEAAELFLEKDPPALGELRAILADIRKDDQRASDVIHRMRALLRRHEIDPVPLSPGDLIEDAVALTRPDAIQRRVMIEREIAPGTPGVRGDRVHLQQVLLNLLLNGMDAMGNCPAERRRVKISVGPAGDHAVEFAVADAGHGITPDSLERIFESFFTTKTAGLGLGLSISRTIIEAHHGRIWAENNTGGGATIRFTLPAGGKDESPTRGKEARHEPAIRM